MNVSRSAAKPDRPHYAWTQIENISLARAAEEKTGQFGRKIAELGADIVVDMIAFDLNSTKHLVEALREIDHYLFCSSISAYGRYFAVPWTELDPPNPIDDYGRGKAESEA